MKTSELKKVVSTVGPALSKTAIIEQTDHFIFDGKYLYGINDKFAIRKPFKIEGSFAIPGAELSEVIHELDGEETEFHIKDNQLELVSGNTKAGITIIKDLKIQDLIASAFAIKKWETLPDNFIEAISMCIFSASKDTTRGVLNSVFVSADAITSSDDFRISKYKLSSPIKSTFLLSVLSSVALSKLPAKKMCVNDNWASFITDDDTVFSARIFNEAYPKVDKHFAIEGTKIEFPEGMKSAVDGVAFFAEGEVDLDKKILVSINKGEIVCRGNKEKGWIEKTIPYKHKHKNFSFQTNPTFFGQMLTKSLLATVGKEAILLETDNFKHVISLPSE